MTRLKILKRFYWVLLILLSVATDQVTKHLVMQNLDYRKPVTVIQNFFSLTYTRNDGVAFGFLGGGSAAIRVVVILITFATILIVVWTLARQMYHHPVAYISLSLVVGGGIGNLVDRVIYHEVVDFLSFTFGTWDFAIFNMADVFVCCGTFLFLIYFVFLHDKKQVKEEISDGTDLSEE